MKIRKTFANILTNVRPSAVIDTPLDEELDKVIVRDYISSSIPADLGKDKRGFQYGQLTYKK